VVISNLIADAAVLLEDKYQRVNTSKNSVISYWLVFRVCSCLNRRYIVFWRAFMVVFCAIVFGVIFTLLTQNILIGVVLGLLVGFIVSYLRRNKRLK